VTIRTKSGQEHSATVYAPKGSAGRGVSWEDVEAKFRALMPASGQSSERIEDTLAAIKSLRQALDLTPLLNLVSGR
jgi:2-methylcitrate dehydratase PrpD